MSMAQLTVYIDEDTLKRIEKAAKAENCSVSKWVRDRLVRDLKTTWPKGYFELFGSLAGERLERPEQPRLENDVPRQSL